MPWGITPISKNEHILMHPFISGWVCRYGMMGWYYTHRSGGGALVRPGFLGGSRVWKARQVR
jgi:hypothetical protein